MRNIIKTVLFSATILQLACGNGDSSDGTNGDFEQERAIPVQTHLVEMDEIADVVQATGTVFPIHDVLVASETAGKIIGVYVGIGDQVEKNAALVQVDPEMKQLALDQAQAKLKEAGAAFHKAEKDLERNKELRETEDISEYVFETAQLQRESAEAAFLMAQANVKMARRQLADARIVSPVAGLVAARMVEIGSTVGPGAPIAKVVNIDEIKVKFGVSEKDVMRITVGQSTNITLDSYPEESFTGVVTAVGPQADLSTRTFPIEVTVKNPAHKLKAGMAVRVEIAAQTVEAPLIPKSALLERRGERLVFVIEHGVARKRIPKLGLESGDRIAVVEGVEAGEEVVVLGQENLSDGAKVIGQDEQD